MGVCAYLLSISLAFADDRCHYNFPRLRISELYAIADIPLAVTDHFDGESNGASNNRELNTCLFGNMWLHLDV